jgi:hypothetical protein
VNLAPSVLLPAKVRKENPFLPYDANPRPYPNEYGRLFFEDESGNNRMVTSERTGEWAAASSAIATGEQHPYFVHPFGGRSMYCIAILLCLQPLSGQNKDDVHLFL